ncbi:hypothetical protein L6241_14725 [Janibacter sp. Y6]|uniref:hypothetical protein n=1 Tax=Janibacter sp. Y6 TaxID=2913552 RepID=UPI0034A5D4F9
MNTTQDSNYDLIAGLIDDQEERAGSSDVDVDAVVTSGRRTIRRRRTATTGLGAAAALAVGLTVGTQTFQDAVAPPAAGEVQISQCAADPKTCSSEEVDRWIESATGVEVTDPGTFDNAPTEMPVAATYYRPVTSSGEMAIVVGPNEQGDDLFDGFFDPARGEPVVVSGGLRRWEGPLPTTGGWAEAGMTTWAAWSTGPRSKPGILVIWRSAGAMPTDDEVTHLIAGLTGR